MLEEFEYNGKAMGTDYSIAIVCSNKNLADNIGDIAKRDIEEAESRFSRFLPSSELSILNEYKKMFVSEFFLGVAEKAQQLFIKTKGIFNPLVQVSRLGYDRNFDQIENGKIAQDDEPYDIDFSTVIIDKDKLKINLNKGQKLDYGGFLKGYLAEVIAKKIKTNYQEVVGVIVNIGGDIHTEGTDKDGHKSTFKIYNPITKGDDIEVPLSNESLATSGIYKRTWQEDGKKIHHILDSTGLENPDTDIISASVIHKDGASSEAFTKVFLSMDYKKAEELLKDENLSFVIIKQNGQIIKSAAL